MSDFDPNKSPQENLERIAQTLERIEKHLAPPPLWQRGLKFGFEHFVMITGMIALVFFIWQIWGYVSIITNQVDVIKNGFTGITSGVGDYIPEGVKDLKFWE